ncbi:MAG: ATP-grasp domain-containing protein [Calditrichaeota bacterium]|nr:ATP-grasp domain-containing protein [Calditrichota bacterium]
MNVLFTCAGRRNYLLQYFREELPSGSKIIAADASPFAPALADADIGYIVPESSSDNYIDILLDICMRERVALLIPLNDLELPILAEARDRFLSLGTFPLVSERSVIDICGDKYVTGAFCARNGINYPHTMLDIDETLAALEKNIVTFPLIIKPRWGSASIGIQTAKDLKELGTSYALVKRQIESSLLRHFGDGRTESNILIQQKLIGTEYGLDVINDLAGENRGVAIRRKITMRAGETDRAEIVENDAIYRIGVTIGRFLRHIGNLDCDIFVVGEDIFLLEMNPRFGGGYPFSHFAGLNLPAALIAWVQGQPESPGLLRATPGVISAKCDRLVGIDNRKLNYAY